jgi:ABC-type multidrug transport system fused ATPase/permease subunit
LESDLRGDVQKGVHEKSGRAEYGPSTGAQQEPSEVARTPAAAPQKAARYSRFRRAVMDYLRGAKGSLFFAAVCMLGVTVMELLRPWPLAIVFDHVLADNPLPWYLSPFQGLFQGGKMLPLLTIAIAIVLIAVFTGIFAYLQVYITSRIGSELVYTLRRRLFAHLQRLSLTFHNRSKSGEHLTKIVSDTNTLRDIFTELALKNTSQLLTFVGMFGIMFFLNWQLALVVVATIPLFVGVFLYRFRAAKSSSRKQRKKEEEIANRVTEVLSTVPVVQAFSREEHEEERFEVESGEYLRESIRNARIEAVATRSVTIIVAFGTAAVVLVGALQVLAGTISPGDLLVFAAYLQSMYKPIRSMANFSTRYSKAAASAERIGEILEVEPDIKDAPDAVVAPPLRGEISFEDVSFDYGDDNDVLEGVSFDVLPGQRVALVGASGAGKSTLVSLILRLHESRSGAIRIDGRNIKEYKLKSLRQQIGIVLQDSVLFGTTIKENIAYGKLDATTEEIIQAAKAANAHDFIKDLEDGYETVIGERGDTLSGGQRQRIAIARAVIRNAPLLILDEPMAGLDVESEAKVQEALDRLMAGKTSLVITHDLHAVAGADLILVLEGGRIVEHGSHDNLMAQSRHYRQLHDLKLGRNDAEKLS